MRMNEMVGGWMADRPVTLAPSRPVIEAYALMAEYAIRHIPVVEEGRLVGIISDRDLHRAAPLRAARGAAGIEALFAVPVAEVMTREGFLTVDPLTTLAEAARLLVYAKVGSLPAIEEGRLVGILTTQDLLRALMGLPREAEEAAAPPPGTAVRHHLPRRRV